MSHSPSFPLSLRNIKSAFAETAAMYDMRERDVERIFYQTIEEFFKTKDYWIDGDGLQIKSHTVQHRRLADSIWQDMNDNQREVPAKVIAWLKKIPNTSHQERVYHEYLLGGFEHAKRYLRDNSIPIDGKAQEHIGYKNLSKREFSQFYKQYVSNIKHEHIENLKRYISGILDANDGILYCEKIKYSPGDNIYHLRPLLSKKAYLDTLIVTVKPEKNRDGEQVCFPPHLKRIPIHIGRPKRNRNALSDKHASIAHGEIMDHKLADFHLSILNKRLKEKHDVDLELKAVKVNAKGTRIQYESAYKLPVDVIKVIGRYFRSFNAHAYIIND
jgi:hypothetical protein